MEETLSAFLIHLCSDALPSHPTLLVCHVLHLKSSLTSLSPTGEVLLWQGSDWSFFFILLAPEVVLNWELNWRFFKSFGMVFMFIKRASLSSLLLGKYCTIRVHALGRVWMCVCMFVLKCMCAFECVYVCACQHVCRCDYWRVNINISMSMSVCMCDFFCFRIYLFMYIYRYI